MPLREHILHTLQQVGRHAQALGGHAGLQMLREDVERDHNDARWLRERQGKERLLAEVIRQAGLLFRGDIKSK